MVAVLVRLKLTLLRRSFSGKPARVVGVVLGSLWVAYIVGMLAVGLFASRFATATDARLWVVNGLAVLTLGWLLAPLVAFGVDNTVDPSRFALLPLSAHTLRPGLAAAGLIGLPGLALVILAAAQVATWSRSPLGFVVALVAAVLGVAISFLLSRVVTAAFSRALASRRMRDVGAVLIGVLALGVALGNSFISRAVGQDPNAVRRAAETAYTIVSWTPFGWSWAAPADVASGDTLVGLVKLALAAGLAGLLWVAWGRFLARALESIGEAETNADVETSRFVDRICPSNQVGAVAARCLRYWRRDPRYLTSLISVVIVPLMLTFALRDSPIGIMAAPIVLAAMFGPTLMTDLAYDNSAFWVHISTGVPMRADRWGRVMALAVIIVPVTVALVVATAIISGNYSALPTVVALTVALAGVSCGLACAAGAYWPGAAPPPGASPFAVKTGGGFMVMLVLFGCWLATAILCLPVILLVAFGWSALAIPVGVVLAIAVLVAGVRIGARQMERTQPELLARVSS